jgi:Icc-related predicted phosphoesterase
MPGEMNEGRDTMITSTSPEKRVRIAAVGDIHCTKGSSGKFEPLFGSVHERADVLVLCGDLTDHGTVEEAQVLAKEIAHTRIPVVAVLGNHDHEAGTPERVAELLSEAGVQVLDGDAVEFCGVGFAGVKGFLGGFGRGTLGFWGEAAVKTFVQAAIDEALKLEGALAHLKTDRRIALMHYSPIEHTVVGERAEIFPYLGCSRLEEPFMRYPVDVVFHGHAHKGTPEGRTAQGIPVFNVAMPLLLGNGSETPYLLYDV